MNGIQKLAVLIPAGNRPSKSMQTSLSALTLLLGAAVLVSTGRPAMAEPPTEGITQSTQPGIAPAVPTQDLPSLQDTRSAVQPTTLSAPTATLATLNQAYLLGPGDTILVDIFNVPEYSGQQQILADGSVNLQAVGRVNINGLTAQAAEQVISQAYRGELRYPEITVVLETPRPLRVAIAGEVSQPGLYTLSPEANAQFPTVSQAIQAAGGVTQAANLHRVQLRRENGAATPQTVDIDLWALLNHGDIYQDMPLRDGDSIIIGESQTMDLADNHRLAATNLAASAEQDVLVAVVGEVFRPGAYEFEGSDRGDRTTVTQAVQTAGGIKPSADIQHIQVRRLTRSGQEQLIDVNLWALLESGDLSQDLILQQGDTVIIPQADDTTPSELSTLAAANLSPDEVQVNVVGEVASPGQIRVSPHTTLNQAVLAAGGFTDRSMEVVELIRLNPNGTVTQREIEVNLAAGQHPENNPLILNNDVVLVGRNARARFSDQIGGVLRPVLQMLTPLRWLF